MIRPLTTICSWCGGKDIYRAKRKISNGTYQIIDVCRGCNHNANRTHIISYKEIGNIETIPLWIDYTLKCEPCCVCRSQSGVEYHHFAPRHIFGDEAEKWPGAYLCLICHHKWHELITSHIVNCKKCKDLYVKVS